MEFLKLDEVIEEQKGKHIRIAEDFKDNKIGVGTLMTQVNNRKITTPRTDAVRYECDQPGHIKQSCHQFKEGLRT